MNRVKVLIVDDELPARKGIRSLLEKDQAIEILADCRDGASAVTSIKQHKPEIAFLDIQMPGMNGFDVLRALKPNELPIVIFITAYNQYALQAFEAQALDYVLKPVKADRFHLALERAKERLLARNSDDVNVQLKELLDSLRDETKVMEAMMKRESAADSVKQADTMLVKSNGHLIFLKLDFIDWLEATGDYVTIHARGANHLVNETMYAIEKKLSSHKFLRIHRSAIVNIDRIRELQPHFAGDYAVILVDGTKLILSRSYRKKLKQLLKRFL